MGGEHHVSFHNNKRSPCHYIHSKSREIVENDRDRAIWPKIKTEVLNFMKRIQLETSNPQIQRYIDDIEEFNKPSDICLFWHFRDDNTIVGQLMHDVTKILMIAYPGKVCACFDRCSGEEWDMCTFKYGIYNEIPKFHLYQIVDINEPDKLCIPVTKSQHLISLIMP